MYVQAEYYTVCYMCCTHVYVHIKARHTVNISSVHNDSEPIATYNSMPLMCFNVQYVHCVMCAGQKQ